MSHTAKSKHKPKSRDRVVRLFTPTLPGMEMGWQRIVRQADRLVLLAPGSDPQPDGRSGYRHLVAGGCRKGGEPLHPKPTWTLAEGTQVAGAALMDVTGTVLAYFLYREPVRLLTGDRVTVDRVEIDRSIAKVLAYFLYREPVRLLTGDGVTVDRVEIDRSIAKGDGG